MSKYNLDEIARMYNEEKLSQSQIGSKLGISRSRVQQLMRDMTKRSYAEASSNMNDQRTIEFTPQQLQLIYGSMLGDAGLYREVMKSNKTGNPIECYRLTFGHSIKQLAYLEHKREVVTGSEIGERASGHGSTIKYFSFCHTPSLRPIAAICHGPDHRKLVTRKWVDLLDWPAIAYWYMDDGCLIVQKKKKGYLIPRLEFHTESFTRDEVELLQFTLSNQFLLDTRTRKANGDVNQLVIVARFRDQVARFLESLSPFVLPHFAYKLRWLQMIDDTPPAAAQYQQTHIPGT